jgi:aminodeoxyfutalosine deaminase
MDSTFFNSFVPLFCIMRKISADWILPISSPPIPEGVIIVDSSGKIMDMTSRSAHDPATLEVYRGAIVPGFINAHCHLELSHMLGKVDTGTGLIPFITGVVTRRNAPAEEIEDAIRAADQYMYESGIVAVGDISNTTDTFATKTQSQIRYYTFVELFDFLQDNGAEKAVNDWLPVYEKAPATKGHARSLVPHAPYSVSPTLFSKINALNTAAGLTISIHNQETPPENELFLHKSGDFIEFYGKFGISLDAFMANGKPSIHYALEHLDTEQRTLFVHNTLSTRDDVRTAQKRIAQTFWTTCPNANLYIENRLPNYQVLLDTDATVCIGTDSLTSNWQLSIWEEMKAIARYQSYVPLQTMLRWATFNGAQALGFDQELGSIETGKTPGLVLLEAQMDIEKLNHAVKPKRII